MFLRADASQSTSKQSRLEIVDAEFGVVVCRRSPHARFVRVRVAENGLVRASLPKRAPLYLVQELLDSSREEIRKLVATQHEKRVTYHDGMQIGHSHRLEIRFDAIESPQKKLHGQSIVVTLPLEFREHPDTIQPYISEQVKRALKREATAFLPRRLRYLADTFGFEYAKERFGNQKGRWGSCSSSGTISLNVALMNLPHELIDYVLVHELVHTKHMNHSAEFWGLVEQCMPGYKEHRKILKTMSPIC